MDKQEVLSLLKIATSGLFVGALAIYHTKQLLGTSLEVTFDDYTVTIQDHGNYVSYHSAKVTIPKILRKQYAGLFENNDVLKNLVVLLQLASSGLLVEHHDKKPPKPRIRWFGSYYTTISGLLVYESYSGVTSRIGYIPSMRQLAPRIAHGILPQNFEAGYGGYSKELNRLLVRNAKEGDGTMLLTYTEINLSFLDKRGMSPLHYLAQRNMINILKSLLELKPFYAHSVTKDGKSLMDLAPNDESKKIIQAYYSKELEGEEGRRRSGSVTVSPSGRPIQNSSSSKDLRRSIPVPNFDVEQVASTSKMEHSRTT
mmetsp:Transcript_25326/g.35500  ORF Transcript_25326/g.35500 Transcript_25326/m.35500 type:complete len:313 (+) Transcript_25326:234-1172(+)|eukprot:CAMPEP_0168562860 /NCGR_PEP_ID=MMETSP0413-20121227/12357_1 /TAXON_ID=136452 /ORGANISM="Filamoeba nolandi, Strain NC-AS-23-1" /LENGTH=312 /DNA_ID=CAMNT_0008594333 /DNA_START=178 /DNA_END=1116 /DNA_ORIENTATION=-